MVHDPRLVYFGSETKPTLAAGAMAAIAGKPWSQASREAACAALADDLDPIDNTFGSPATKLHLQRVLTQRALDKANERATERATLQ
jgi:xanthine dehydrogenase small subunit